MEFIDNEFNITNANAPFSNNHIHHRPQQQVDHLSMGYIPALPAHRDSHHHLATPFHQYLIPSAELSHKMLDQSRKRKRSSKEGAVEGLKPSDVIHVRAKRGQATDSHSLAERVRREKINEKLKSLHDIFPGCHNTMGMAVMLDVVIKYIQSLQNQIEFLSMKLLAASLFRDLNSSDMDAVETMQDPPHMADAQEMERIGADGYGGGAPYLNSTLFPQESFQNQ